MITQHQQKNEMNSSLLFVKRNLFCQFSWLIKVSENPGKTMENGEYIGSAFAFENHKFTINITRCDNF